jgi:hypothetical protein
MCRLTRICRSPATGGIYRLIAGAMVVCPLLFVITRFARPAPLA